MISHFNAPLVSIEAGKLAASYSKWPIWQELRLFPVAEWGEAGEDRVASVEFPVRAE